MVVDDETKKRLQIKNSFNFELKKMTEDLFKRLNDIAHEIAIENVEKKGLDYSNVVINLSQSLMLQVIQSLTRMQNDLVLEFVNESNKMKKDLTKFLGVSGGVNKNMGG